MFGAIVVMFVAAADPTLDVGTVDDFIFSPDGKALVVLGNKGSAVVDPMTLEQWTVIPSKAASNRVVFSSDGKRVAIAPCEAHLVSLEGKHEDLTLTCPASASGQCVRALIFNPGKPDVILACPDGSVTRRSMKDGKIVATVQADAAPAPPDVSTGARIVPAFEDGKKIGFKLFMVKDDSAWARMGLKNGDVLMSVDGKPMVEPLDLKLLYDSSGKAGLVMEVKRDGRIQKVTSAKPE
jgi:type II secretory pathway component PulC